MKFGDWEIRETKGMIGLYDFSLYHLGVWCASSCRIEVLKDLIK